MAEQTAYGIADICEILDDVKDDTNCVHTDGEDEKMELNWTRSLTDMHALLVHLLGQWKYIYYQLSSDTYVS